MMETTDPATTITQSARELQVHHCPHCDQTFAFKNSLKKHTEKRRCVVLKVAQLTDEDNDAVQITTEESTTPKRRKVAAGGQYCSAVGCNNSTYRDGPRGIKFYRFPTDTERKKKWISLVNRTEPNGSRWNPGTNSRLCSEHFFSGKKSEEPDNPDYQPSIFPTHHVKPKTPSDLARFNRLKRRHDLVRTEDKTQVNRGK